MRTLSLLYCLLLLSAPLFSQVPRNTSEEEERARVARNKIKQTTQWIHKYKQGKPDPKGYKATETKYDKNGNPIEVINYRSNGEVSSRLLYKYDKNNNRTEYLKIEKMNKPQPEVTFKQVFNYDAQGKKVLEVGFDGTAAYKIDYTYHTDGKPKDIIKYNASRQIVEKWDYSYEANKQIIKIYKPENKLDHTVEKVYNKANQLVEETKFATDGKELRKVLFAYNKDGKVQEEAEYYSTKFSKKLIYSYNTKNLLEKVEQEQQEGDKIVYSTFVYDNNENLLEESWFDGDPSDYSKKESDYDKKGNVTEVESYYAPYKYRSLYKYTYEYF